MSALAVMVPSYVLGIAYRKGRRQYAAPFIGPAVPRYAQNLGVGSSSLSGRASFSCQLPSFEHRFPLLQLGAPRFLRVVGFGQFIGKVLLEAIRILG